MNIGQYNLLTIQRFTAPGAYLSDAEGNDILLPGKYLTNDLQVDEQISVFVYRDSEDRIVATTEHPLITLNGFAFLRAIEINAFGAFMDWGLEKHLLVPFKEQTVKIEEKKKYLVTLRLDEATDRLYASMKVNRFIEKCSDTSLLDNEVDLLIWQTTELGVKVIVNNKYQGLIFRNNISKNLISGKQMKGYVHHIREDGKLDIRLEKAGHQKYEDASAVILKILHEEGVLYLCDQSDPDEIREKVGMSKKTFKQAIGKLYKMKQIIIKDNSICLVSQ